MQVQVQVQARGRWQVAGARVQVAGRCQGRHGPTNQEHVTERLQGRLFFGCDATKATASARRCRGTHEFLLQGPVNSRLFLLWLLEGFLGPLVPSDGIPSKVI